MEIKSVLSKNCTEKERINFIVLNNHQLGYIIKETATQYEAWGADENDLLLQKKQEKISLNDEIRDRTLIQGVTYQDVLFDSDTDQKINLLATVNLMSDEDIITWYGMNNDSLECTKADLYAIGQMIITLHSFCWTKNAEIKQAIQEAQTIEDVEDIDIIYTLN